MKESGTSGRRWLLVLAAAASMMTALDTLVVSTALSTIQRDLGATVEQLEWTINGYNLVLAVLLMPAAALGDRFGRKRMFTVGVALFTVSSAACALAPDVLVLVAARVCQGVGAALVTALAMTLVSAAYSADQRGGALGILQGGAGIAVLAGPGLGGMITNAIGWEFIFWLNVPIGLVVIALVLAKVRESHGEDTALDVRGLLLVTGAALGVVWALARGNTAGWASVEVLAAFVAGCALAVGFVAWERRANEPMMPLRLFRSRAFVAANLATVGLFASIFGGVFFFSQLLQTGLGFTPLQAGLGLMPWTSALIVLAPVAGKLADRFGNRPFMVGGLIMSAVGFAWVALIARTGMSYGELVLPFLVASIGGSAAMPAAASAVMGAVAPAEVGKASGINNMLRELGGVLGLAVMVAVFATAGSYVSPATFLAGFSPAIGIAAALVGCGAVAAAFVPGRRAERPTPRTPDGPAVIPVVTPA